MNSATLGIVLAAALMTAACDGKAASPDGRDVPHAAAVLAAAAPTIEDAAGATYFGEMDRRFTLRNGEWRSPEGEQLTLMREFYATADINGDGAMNAAVILKATNAGPRNGAYLAALRRDHLTAISIGAVKLGEPVTIKALRSDGREIVVDLLRRGPSDQECCPTEPATLRYRYQDKGLVLITEPVR